MVLEKPSNEECGNCKFCISPEEKKLKVSLILWNQRLKRSFVEGIHHKLSMQILLDILILDMVQKFRKHIGVVNGRRENKWTTYHIC